MIFLVIEKTKKICYNERRKQKESKAKMEKIHNNLNIENLIKTEWFNQFSDLQKTSIIDGLKDNVDVSIYAKKEFQFHQME